MTHPPPDTGIPAEPAMEDNGQQFCTFRIGHRLFGVQVTDIKEIHSLVPFTPVSHARGDVKGLVNIRGMIHLIIDLRLLLELPPKNVQEDSRIILLKPHVGEAFGMLVDKIGDVITASADQMEQAGPPESMGREDAALIHRWGLVQGVCKLPEELMVILSAEKLLQKVNRGHHS